MRDWVGRWLSWTCDALDFFSVSLSVTTLGKVFDKEPHDIVRPPPIPIPFVHSRSDARPTRFAQPHSSLRKLIKRSVVPSQKRSRLSPPLELVRAALLARQSRTY